MVIAVVDGMGGSIGHQIILQLRKELPEETEIIALGTNSIATMNMMKARANRGGTGENSIKVCAPGVDVIMGSLSILVPNSMMGELTPEMATALATSKARKILLPLTNPRIEIMGLTDLPIPRMIEEAIALLKKEFELAEEKGNEDV
jgi:hypothetical protein